MVEVASSNLAGPTKFLSVCFSSILFFIFAESSRVMASYLYPGKVPLKEWHYLDDRASLIAITKNVTSYNRYTG